MRACDPSPYCTCSMGKSGLRRTPWANAGQVACTVHCTDSRKNNPLHIEDCQGEGGRQCAPLHCFAFVFHWSAPHCISKPGKGVESHYYIVLPCSALPCPGLYGKNCIAEDCRALQIKEDGMQIGHQLISVQLACLVLIIFIKLVCRNLALLCQQYDQRCRILQDIR